MPAWPYISPSNSLNDKNTIILIISKIPICIAYGAKYHANNCFGVNKNDINKNDNSCNTLQKIRVNNPLKIVVGQLSINSARNKLDAHCKIFKHKKDILLVFEVKIDDALPVES